MRITVIACQVLYRQISFLSAQSKNSIHTVYLPQGLHNTPQLLKKLLQKHIDEESFSSFQPEAIVLGYGLCSNGPVGITAKNVPLVIARTDDCIGLFLGSQKRYLSYFNHYKGIYWYNPGWIEWAFTPSLASYAQREKEYLEKYDPETVEYLMKEEKSWTANYRHAVYITSSVYDSEKYRSYTRKAAKDFQWNYLEAAEDHRLLKKLLDGNWDDEEILICKPGRTFAETFDHRKLEAR